jgi:hypothetical protein
MFTKIAVDNTTFEVSGKGYAVRLFRKILVVISLSLLLVLALAAGGAATALYASFGSGKSVTAEGPAINQEELQSCSVVLIDLERIEIGLPDQLTLLPSPTEELVISTVPKVNLNGGLLPRETVDSAILGSDTCILSFESEAWLITHSALGQPWLGVGANTGFTQSATGTSISFDVNSAANSTLIIEFTDPEFQVEQITLDAQVSYSHANIWALGLAIGSSVFLILFVTLVVIVIVKKTKRPQS